MQTQWGVVSGNMSKILVANVFFVVDNMLLADTFTFLSPCHNSTSWLDHALCGMNISARSVKVRHDLSVYDHFPLFVEIDLVVGTVLKSPESIHSDRINWNNFDPKMYILKLDKIATVRFWCLWYYWLHDWPQGRDRFRLFHVYRGNDRCC